MSDRHYWAQQICETGWLLHERGFIAASEGNLSCRLSEDEILCTPTLVGKGFMQPENLCVVDLEGRQISGARTRSSEVLLHLELYRKNPQTGAVVHCHPPHATAFALSSTPLPSGLLAEVEYFLQDIPTIEYHTPGTAALAESLAPHAQSSCCALLRNHGAVAWAADLTRTRWWMEILEAYCRAVILARQLGDLAPLRQQEIAELRRLGQEMRDHSESAAPTHLEDHPR